MGEENSPVKLIRQHPLESALVWITALHLVFLPWALGTMHPWSQITSGILAALGLSVALLPRSYDESTSLDGRRFKLYTFPRLLRFPVFWLGLTLLLYILIQALNPAWRYFEHESGRFWWMLPIQHITWLPSGMDTPFAKTNAWRYLLIYGSAWAVCCSLWIGITRRRSILILIGTLVTSGTIFTLVGILQKITGATKILWFYDHPVKTFFGTIIYKNHAAAYLYLVMGALLGLALWLHERSTQRLEKSGPGLVLLFVPLLFVVGLALTDSRAGMAVGAMLFILGFGRFAWITFSARSSVSPIPIAVVTLMMAFLTGLTLSQLDWQRVVQRFQQIGSHEVGQRLSTEGRHLAREATTSMWQDQKIRGWGAGSFRFYFPVYQKEYPFLLSTSWENSDGTTRTINWQWEYAHNDWIQLLAELGIAGGAVTLLLICWLGREIRRRQRWRHVFVQGLLAISFFLALHCWIDFQSHCPAVLTTFTVLVSLAIRWTDFETNS